MATTGSLAASGAPADERSHTPTELVDRHLLVAEALFASGRPAEAAAEAERAMAVAGLSGERRAAAERTALECALALGRTSRIHALAGSLLAPTPVCDERSLVAALQSFAWLAWEEGRVIDALAFGRAALQRDAPGLDGPTQMHPELLLAPMLLAVGALDEAAACMVHALAPSECDPWAAAPTILHARLALAAGRSVDAEHYAACGLATALATGSLLVPVAAWTAVAVALHVGDVDAVGRAEERGRVETPPRGGIGALDTTWFHARLLEARAGPDGVLATVADGPSPPVGSRMLAEEPASAAWFVRTALAGRDRRWAVEVARSADDLAARNPGVTTLSAASEHAHGVLERDARALASAVQGHRHAWARASACEDLGVVRTEQAGPAAGRPHLERAADAYEHAGARRDAARVHERLRRAATNPRRRSDRPTFGWSSLTAAERRVATEVAAGRTNAEIARRIYVSRHTVDFHLRQIFRKLSVRSRVELTRLVLEAEETGDMDAPR
jgi:DNA-binding CsgD family transcriptional regulator